MPGPERPESAETPALHGPGKDILNERLFVGDARARTQLGAGIYQVTVDD
jgi:hypothetical protein